MTIQPATKKRPTALIIIGAFIGICILCVIASLAMDALGLLPETTPIPTNPPISTNPPDPTQIISPTFTPAQTYFEEYGGNIDVYNEIFTSNDCVALQGMFDQAESNLKFQEPGTPQYRWGIGYMAASDDHMKAIGCY